MKAWKYWKLTWYTGPEIAILGRQRNIAYFRWHWTAWLFSMFLLADSTPEIEGVAAKDET